MNNTCMRCQQRPASCGALCDVCYELTKSQSLWQDGLTGYQMRHVRTMSPTTIDLLDELAKYEYGGRRYVVPPREYWNSSSNIACWKCKYYLTNREAQDNKSKLCDDCNRQLTKIRSCVIGILYLIGVSLVAPTYSNSLLGRVVEVVLYGIGFIAFLALVGVAILAVILLVIGLFHLMKSIYGFFHGWVEALYFHVKDVQEESKQKELQEGKERAKLAKLNGQQLDSLLTEEYMKRQGWK